eukprot:7281942-Pyramimonas_sp.AAC.1
MVGPRLHRWIRLEILVRLRPGKGPVSSGIDTTQCRCRAMPSHAEPMSRNAKQCATDVRSA